MDEIKSKISETLKGRIFTEEHKHKLSESAKKRKGKKTCNFKGMKYEDYMPKEKSESIKLKISNTLAGRKIKDILGEEGAKLRNEKISKTIKQNTDKRHAELFDKYKKLDSGLSDREKCNALGISYPTYLKIKQLGLSSDEP